MKWCLVWLWYLRTSASFKSCGSCSCCCLGLETEEGGDEEEKDMAGIKVLVVVVVSWFGNGDVDGRR